MPYVHVSTAGNNEPRREISQSMKDFYKEKNVVLFFLCRCFILQDLVTTLSRLLRHVVGSDIGPKTNDPTGFATFFMI